VIGIGGIQSGADALAMLRAGATLVAVGTESFRDPAAGSKVAADLSLRLANDDDHKPGSGPIDHKRVK
jgi:dihydroorotate dehydrogenase (NAD+) catalytic subunit